MASKLLPSPEVDCVLMWTRGNIDILFNVKIFENFHPFLEGHLGGDCSRFFSSVFV